MRSWNAGDIQEPVETAVELFGVRRRCRRVRQIDLDAWWIERRHVAVERVDLRAISEQALGHGRADPGCGPR